MATAVHQLSYATAYSRQLRALSPSSGNPIDRVIEDDIAAGFATELARVAIQGDSASDEPTGILNTSGVGIVPIGTNGGAPTYEHLVDLEHALGVADADDVGGLGFLTTPGMRKQLRRTEAAAGSGFVWDRNTNTILGHPAEASTIIPSDLAKGTGTNLHAIIHGAWADLAVVLLPVLDLVVDPMTRKDRGLIEVTAYLYLDVVVRHAASFEVIKDAAATL